MKRIGIVGGTSPESTLYYYRNFIEISRELFPRNFYPEMVIFNINFKKFKDLETWELKEKYLLESIRALEDAGAQVIGIAANTPHMVFDSLKIKARAKMVSIIDAVAQEAKKRDYKKLLLMGTKTTMTSGFYVEKLKKHGLMVKIPEDYIDVIDRIIFDELSQGILKSKGILKEIAEKYDVDAIILGCTELPLALKEGDTKAPLLDTAKIHMRRLIEEAIE